MLLATGRPCPAIYKRKWVAAVTLSVRAHAAACLGNNTSGQTRTVQAFSPVSFVRLMQNKLAAATQTASRPPSMALPAVDGSRNPNTTAKTRAALLRHRGQVTYRPTSKLAGHLTNFFFFLAPGSIQDSTLYVSLRSLLVSSNLGSLLICPSQP